MTFRPDTSFDEFVRETTKAFKARNIVAFCGAGISFSSGLPLANDLIRYLLSKTHISKQELDTILRASMPFEAFMEIVLKVNSDLRLLDLFNVEEPNTNHVFLAKLAKRGYLRTICTTNFDRLIERAFDQEGLVEGKDYVVYYKEAELDDIDSNVDTIRLIKVHGSIDDKDGMAITLSQVASKIMSEQRKGAIQEIFARGAHETVLILGYSCSDTFDISLEIESIDKGLKRILFVEHYPTDENQHKREGETEDIVVKNHKNPFQNAGLGTRIYCSTDQFIKVLWVKLLNDPYLSVNPDTGNNLWKKCVDNWFVETESKDARVLKYSIVAPIFFHISEFNLAIEYYSKALTIVRKTQDRRAEGVLLGNIGGNYHKLGNYNKAIEFHQKALQIGINLGNIEGQGVSHGNIGATYHELGNYHKAIQNFKRALEFAHELGDTETAGVHLGNLGAAYSYLGEYQIAIDFLEKALQIARECGGKHNEQYSLGFLGEIHEILGKFQTSVDYYTQALNVAKEIGDKEGQGRVLGDLATAYRNLGDYGKAIEFRNEALQISRHVGDKQGNVVHLSNLGNIYADLGDYQKALKYYEQSLHLAKEIEDKHGESSILNVLGGIYHDLAKPDVALGYLEQALEIKRNIGDKLGEVECYGNLGLAYSGLGDLKKAINYHEQALKIARTIGYKKGQVKQYGFLGALYIKHGEFGEAIESLNKALTLAKEIEDRQGEAIYLGNLGSAYANIGEFEQAVESYEKALSIFRPMLGNNHPHTKMMEENLHNVQMYLI